MPLESGTYYILNGNDYVRRFAAGSCPPSSEKIFCPLPGHNQPETWEVEALGENLYKLKANGAYTAALEGRLCAVPLPDSRPEPWMILEQPRHEGSYTIQTANRDGGWIRVREYDEDDDTNIKVKPLIVGPSYPPYFPPFELWKFQRVGSRC